MSFITGSLVDLSTGRKWSPRHVWEQTTARAARYRARGLGPGMRVLLLADNTLEFFAELLAVWHVGATAVPVDSTLPPFELDHLIAAADPAMIVQTAVHMAVQPAAPTDTGPRPWHTSVPLLDAQLLDAQLLDAQLLDAQRLDARDIEREIECGDVASMAPAPVGTRRRLDDDALILFTSGSTGNPKGVLHTHRTLFAQWRQLQQSLGTGAYRRTACLLPVYFGHGLICNALFPLLSGCDLYLGPAFSPGILSQLGPLIDRHGITAMSSVPALWRLALRLSPPPRTGSLTRVHCGSAPLSAELWRSIAAWTGTGVINTYGITETASWLGGSLDEAPADGLIGHAWGGEIRVLRAATFPDGPIWEAECAPGEEGHVWVRTPALMKGYFQRDGRIADSLTRAVVAGEWFYTGDLGVRAESGAVSLCGRAIDEINKGGLKIQPQDVELVAAACPQVSDVCVFAVDDRLYGQNVGIALVMADRRPELLRTVHEFMRERLSRHKMPAVWHAVDALPRTARGKIQRRTVAAMCAGRQAFAAEVFSR